MCLGFQQSHGCRLSTYSYVTIAKCRIVTGAGRRTRKFSLFKRMVASSRVSISRFQQQSEKGFGGAH